MKNIIISVILVYILLLFAIAYWSNKKIKNNNDYLIAGRSINFWVVAATISATEIGGGSSISIIEKTYGDWGLGAIWYILAMAVAFWVISIFAPKMRSADVRTIPEYFRRRYGSNVALLTSAIMIFPLIGLAASQFIVGASIVNTVFGINYHIAVTIIAITTIVYTYMGGYYGISRAHVMQLILLFAGFLLCIGFIIQNIDGITSAVFKTNFIKTVLKNKMDIKTVISLIVMYIASFSVGQELLPGFYSSKDESTARKGSLLAGFVNVAFSVLPVTIGILIVYSFSETNNNINGDVATVTFNVLKTSVSPLILGVFFIGILAAIMSSADSDIFGAASIYGNDIYRIYINKNPTERQALDTTRKTIVFVGILAFFVALFSKTNVIDLLMLSFAFRAGGVFIPYILGHYWKNASEQGAMVAILSGSIVVIIMDKANLTFFGFTSPVLSIIVSFVMFVVISKLFPNKNNTTNLTKEENFSIEIDDIIKHTEYYKH